MVVPKQTYFAVFGSLLALTLLTTGAAFIDMGKWNTVVALVIAATKASLVILFFMHLRWSSSLMRVVMPAVLLWLALLICLTLMDFTSRGWLPVPIGWSAVSESR